MAARSMRLELTVASSCLGFGCTFHTLDVRLPDGARTKARGIHVKATYADVRGHRTSGVIQSDVRT